MVSFGRGASSAGAGAAAKGGALGWGKGILERLGLGAGSASAGITGLRAKPGRELFVTDANGLFVFRSRVAAANLASTDSRVGPVSNVAIGASDRFLSQILMPAKIANKATPTKT
jgi:hypothetical protein